MFDEIIDIKTDLERLKTNFGNMAVVGPIEVVEPKGYRIKLGDTDEGPYLSPWYPHPETGKSSVPLKKGQIVGVLNPSGDPRQGVLFRGGYSDEHPSPSENMEANVFEDAGVRVELVDGALVLTAGGTSFSFSAAGFFVKGGRLDHDGKDFGKTHKHGGIVIGNSNTDVPNP